MLIESVVFSTIVQQAGDCALLCVLTRISQHTENLKLL